MEKLEYMFSMLMFEQKLIKNSDVEINKLTVDISKIDDSDLNLIRGFMKFENYLIKQ